MKPGPERGGQPHEKLPLVILHQKETGGEADQDQCDRKKASQRGQIVGVEFLVLNQVAIEIGELEKISGHRGIRKRSVKPGISLLLIGRKTLCMDIHPCFQNISFNFRIKFPE